ncbi:MAG: hypothetical protein P4K93_07590 [Terracidiphilus sp.]|nr:hypothetical protein [Terracidiphilus sp.]
MVRTMKVLFCDNEHGCGDVTFPDLHEVEASDVINPPTLKGLRREAHAAGWKRHNGADYCPDCVACKLEVGNGSL